jgi:hypothetical protein
MIAQTWPVGLPVRAAAPSMSLDEALAYLKDVEDQGTAFRPTREQNLRLAEAVTAVRATGKYVVDPKTHHVSFAPAPPGSKRKIDTIEDFILFAEAVEQALPGADAKAVTSEIRQIWFRDENWELLVGSSGIPASGPGGSQAVDLRTDPAMEAFDMKDLRGSGEKTVTTPFGVVAISHVLAGMDAALSGFPASMPPGGTEKDVRQLKYDTLKASTGGDPRPFTTWAGDLGQGYGDYLVRRYVLNDIDVKLEDVMGVDADETQLLGDIHGYILLEASGARRPTPAGKAETCSGLLRNFYLQKPPAGETYEGGFLRASGKSKADLVDFVTQQSVAFARIWFAKKELEARGGSTAGGWWKSKGWTKKGILEYNLKDFDKAHQTNEDKAGAEDKLETYVDQLLKKVEERQP